MAIITTKRLKESRKELKKLYSQIPETTGCKENHHTCNAICCQKQNPQTMYVEFLNTWNTISNTWKSEQLIELLVRCVRNYFLDSQTKGCVFWNKDTKLCEQHSTRPFNCRIYSITPHQEFQSRYDRLKIIYPEADFMPQCNLTRTTNGPMPTMADTDAWFHHLKQIEESIGIDPKLIHDGELGSYRNFHDHILVKMCRPELLDKMTQLKLKGTDEQKEKFIVGMVESMREFVSEADASKSSKNQDH